MFFLIILILAFEIYTCYRWDLKNQFAEPHTEYDLIHISSPHASLRGFVVAQELYRRVF